MARRDDPRIRVHQDREASVQGGPQGPGHRGSVDQRAPVHVGHDLTVVGSAQGWNADTWRPVLDNLAAMMSWTRPVLPKQGDPSAFAGSPAKG